MVGTFDYRQLLGGGWQGIFSDQGCYVGMEAEKYLVTTQVASAREGVIAKDGSHSSNKDLWVSH